MAGGTKSKLSLGFMWVLLAVFFLPQLAHATPQIMRVDGSIFDNAGNPYSGATSIGVKAYTAASGGTLLWTAPSSYTPTATNGRFTIDLDASAAGPTSSLTSTISSQGSGGSVWFELSYSGNTVRPRIRSRGTAFSVSTAVADSANALQGVSVSTLSPVSGNVLTYNGSTWLPGAGSAGGSFVSKLGDTMSGALNVGANVIAQNHDTNLANGTYSIGGNVVLAVGTASSGNLFVGGGGSNVTSGALNTFLGMSSGSNVNSGADNTFLGYGAGYAVTTGINNTFVGTYAGNNASGVYNTYVGMGSGLGTTSGIKNSFFGTEAGFFNSTGSYNTVFGTLAGSGLGTNSYNTLMGMSSNVSSSATYSVGLGALAVVNASSAVQLGTGTNATNDTLQFNNYNFLTDSGAATFASINGVTTVTSAYLNGLTGNVQSQINSISGGSGNYVSKLGDTMSGALNVGANVNAQNLNATNVNGTISIGGSTILSVGTGANLESTFLGASQGNGSSTGQWDTYVGWSAGQSNTTGSQNSFFGTSAGQNTTTGSGNVSFGYVAGSHIGSGSSNAYFGAQAGHVATGNYNVFIGGYAGQTVSSQSNDTFVGYNSGDNTGLATQTVALGYQATISASSAVQLGTGTNATNNSLQFNGYNFLKDTGAATFASINGVTTVTSAYLNGITGNIQSQINSLGGSGAYVSKTGDTMSGALNVGANVNAQNLALTNTNGVISIGGTTMFAVGTGALSGNLFMGGSNNGAGVSGGYNFVWGNVNTGANLSSGSGNILMQQYAGQNLSTASSDIFIGWAAGRDTTTGGNNIFIGNSVGYDNVTGANNAYFGNYAGQTSTSSNNTFIGELAGTSVSTQGNNTFVGSGSDNPSSTASQATALGYNALVNASSAVQLGAGTNPTANSLQFNGYNFLKDSGAATFANVNVTGLATNAALVTDGSRNIATSSATAQQIGYLANVTGDIQAQINNTAHWLPLNYIGGGVPLFVSTSTLTGSAGVFRDSTNAVNITVSSASTVSLGSTGLNGLDTGTKAASTWYYLYAVTNGTTSGYMLSTTNEVASGSISNGNYAYTAKRQLPFAALTDTTSSILPFRVAEGWPARAKVIWRDYAYTSSPYQFYTGAPNTWVTTSVSSVVPPIAHAGIFEGFPTSNATYSIFFRATGTTGTFNMGNFNTNTAQIGGWTHEIEVNSSQQIDVSSGGGGLSASALGFIVTEVP